MVPCVAATPCPFCDPAEALVPPPLPADPLPLGVVASTGDRPLAAPGAGAACLPGCELCSRGRPRWMTPVWSAAVTPIAATTATVATPLAAAEAPIVFAAPPPS